MLTKSDALVGTLGYTVTIFVPEARTAPVDTHVTLQGKLTLVVEQKFPLESVMGMKTV